MSYIYFTIDDFIQKFDNDSSEQMNFLVQNEMTKTVALFTGTSIYESINIKQLNVLKNIFFLNTMLNVLEVYIY